MFTRSKPLFSKWKKKDLDDPGPDKDLLSLRNGGNAILFQNFEASNCGQSSCRCTLDQWLDLIGVISS